MKRTMRQIIELTLALVISISQPLFAVSQTQMQNHWAYDSMISLAQDGIFSPLTRDWNLDSHITRQEFVRLVNRAFGFDIEGEMAFTDVSESSLYYSDILTAAELGLIQSHPGGAFKPDDYLTRQEAASTLSKVSKKESVMSRVIIAFSDGIQIPEKDQENMAWMIQNQYMIGYEDGTIGYDRQLTYGEALAAVDNILGVRVAEDLVGDTNHIEGNVTIIKTGVNLQDMVINGDLIIGGQVGDGHVTLKNTIIKGRLIVYGGGQNTIELEESHVKNMMVSRFGSPVRVRADKDSSIANVRLDSSAVLEAEDDNMPFKKVMIQPLVEKMEVKLEGHFEHVSIEKPKIEDAEGTLMSFEDNFDDVKNNEWGVMIEIGADTVIGELEVNSEATIQGDGKIEKAKVNDHKVRIEAEIESIKLSDDVVSSQQTFQSEVEPDSASSNKENRDRDDRKQSNAIIATDNQTPDDIVSVENNEDTDTMSVVFFELDLYEYIEGNTVEIPIKRTGNLSQESEVSFLIENEQDSESNENGQPSWIRRKEVTFAIGEERQVVTFFSYSDRIIKDDYVYKMSIESIEDNTIIGEYHTAEVRIVDDGVNDPVVFPTVLEEDRSFVSFETDAYSVMEGESISIPVLRTGNPENVFRAFVRALQSVDEVDEGSADEVDISQFDGVLTFEADELIEYVEIHAIADKVSEGPETFRLELEQTDKIEAYIEGIDEITITILDSNSQGSGSHIEENVSVTSGSAIEVLNTRSNQ